MLINEVSLILAEKRTALSVLRTGLAVLILPLSVVSVLVAVSRLYDPAKVMYLLAPLLGISVLLAFFGLYLIYRSFKKTLSLDRLSLELKKQNPQLRLLAQLMEPGFGADPYDDLAKQLEPASPIETIPPANQPAKQPPEPSTP
jgi:uncharacterized membrane protein YidH (DUF202 family)